MALRAVRGESAGGEVGVGGYHGRKCRIAIHAIDSGQLFGCCLDGIGERSEVRRVCLTGQPGYFGVGPGGINLTVVGCRGITQRKGAL